MSSLAVVLAVLAALALAGGVVLQARGVRAAGVVGPGVMALGRAIVREPVWWGGMALAGVSGLTHTAALKEGALVEVEPIMVTSLLFALAFGSVLSRQRVSRRDWLAAGSVAVGLVVFLVAADPHGDRPVDGAGRWLVLAGVVGALAVVLVTVARRATSPNLQAAAWASNAALLLGTSAVLLKEITNLLDGGLGDVVTSPALWALGLCELGAIVSQQLAFRTGDFAAAVAPFVGGNPLVAGAIGIVIFGERFHTDPLDLVGAGIGIVMVAVGITLLATSPLVAVGSGEETAPAI